MVVVHPFLLYFMILALHNPQCLIRYITTNDSIRKNSRCALRSWPPIHDAFPSSYHSMFPHVTLLRPTGFHDEPSPLLLNKHLTHQYAPSYTSSTTYTMLRNVLFLLLYQSQNMLQLENFAICTAHLL
ncbi:hypothetical protein AB4K20DRAFT_1965235 [Rhizopus microsporus]|uniref:Secreted protein n=1 Tax=Rhizopus microsporus TaxID=58291 RepID=A0A1X0RXA2_RHIZD|nr:hypothetical protein BCV71DRAFT_236556 [Rhizopus microsporus]